MSTPLPAYAAELDIALRNVHRASLLTKSVLRELKNNVSAETKADDSPVTIADFAAQALLIAALHAVYPEDRFIGEESADALRQNESLAQRVWQLVLRAKERDHASIDGKDEVQSVGGALAFPTSKEDMFDLIDMGGKSEVTGQGRVWVMDPVDGTATFMQGQQYAVALCLLVDGVQQVGVIGCPNLAFDIHGSLDGTRVHEDRVDTDGYGVVVSAVKGQGTFVRSMLEHGLSQPRRIDLESRPPKPLKDLNFVEATIGKTSLSQAEHQAVAESLGVTSWPGTVIWSQQVKYITLALGASDVIVRIPKTLDRFTYIWDHAGGHILFEEAGGMVRDFNGNPIDFGRSRKIKGEVNYGMIACMPTVFSAVDKAVKDVLGRREG